MTYDSPFWAIEGEAIPEVANFKEEGLVTPEGHYSCFEVRLFIIRQSMNFGFWNFFLVQIIADYVNFHMTYHTYIWNHAGWHRSVLNMTHFQLFAWFGQTLLVRKMENKSKFLLGDTIGSKFNFKWSSWVWTMSSYQNLRSI